MILVFATNNSHKLNEVLKIIPPGIKIKSLKDIGCNDELPETGTTIRANAMQKARYIHDKFGENCFADDTGLEVEALGGRPGVYSARFAGPNCDAFENMNKLLIEMKGMENRKALFRTVIATMIDGTENYFEGIIKGTIAESPSGTGGFGYDPIFIPDGFTKTFSEMSESQKNEISHRSVAVKKLIDFLKGV